MQTNSNPKVLIVDDDPLILKSLQEILDGNQYAIATANSGGEAIDYLADNEFDLCILDLIMPGVTGQDVMAYIRARKLDTEIIVLSGDNNIDGAISALSHRASAFVKKPFDPNDLLKTVVRSIKRKWLLRQKTMLNTKIRSSEKLYRFLSNHSPDFIYLLNTAGEFIYVNDRVEFLLGYSRNELVGRHYSVVILDKDHNLASNTFNERRTGRRAIRNLPIRLKRKTGLAPANFGDSQIVCVELNAVGIYSEHDIGTRSQQGSLGIAREVVRTDIQNLDVKFAAYHDVLTGLPNRMLLHDRLSVALDNAKRHGHLLVVMFLDLDGFKEINDSMGHAWGDKVLQIVTDRLQDKLRKADTLARYGGDEFILMLPQIDSLNQVETIAEKVLETIKKPIINNGKSVFISASIGISVFPTDGDTEESLIERADSAMYRVKEQNKNGYHFFSRCDSLSPKHRQYEKVELIDALESDQFVMFYQPVLNLERGQVIGFEGLLRWHHPEKGLIFPADFLPDAREFGLMPRIDDWVFKKVCTDFADLLDLGIGTIKLFLNISVEKISMSDFGGWLECVVSRDPLFAKNLQLEIPARFFLEAGPAVVKKLDSIRNLGIPITVDSDATSGVRQIPFQNFEIYGLKIDCTGFGSKEDPAFACDFKYMSRSLKANGIVLIAKNLESDRNLYTIRSMEFDLVQGFLYHHPLSLMVAKSLILNNIYS